VRVTVVEEKCGERQHCTEPKRVIQTESDGRKFGTELGNIKSTMNRREVLDRCGQGTLVRRGHNKNILKPRSGNVAAERMASIRIQQEAFARKGQKTESSIPRVGRGNIAAERIASIKKQQEAFARKGRPRIEYDTRNFGRGNVAAEKMASIKTQQEAFSRKGRPKIEVDTRKVGRGTVAAEKKASIKS